MPYRLELSLEIFAHIVVLEEVHNAHKVDVITCGICQYASANGSILQLTAAYGSIRDDLGALGRLLDSGADALA